jgi:DNA repair protein RadA/Sms
MVKNDELAGPRQLEHLVDAVYYFEGDPYEELRICTSSKNRFGELETVFFNINEGMKPIANPSEYLITKRKEGVIGSAITIIKEGTMPVAVEVESLISRSFTPYPSRIGDGLRRDQLNITISILEQKNGMNFYDKNVVIKAMGNVKLQEPSTNLAIATSIASSYYKIPMSPDIVMLGDIFLRECFCKIRIVAVSGAALVCSVKCDNIAVGKSSLYLSYDAFIVKPYIVWSCAAINVVDRKFDK